MPDPSVKHEEEGIESQLIAHGSSRVVALQERVANVTYIVAVATTMTASVSSNGMSSFFSSKPWSASSIASRSRPRKASERRSASSRVGSMICALPRALGSFCAGLWRIGGLNQRIGGLNQPQSEWGRSDGREMGLCAGVLAWRLPGGAYHTVCGGSCV